MVSETSPKAWEEERDEKLQNLTWTSNGRQVGLSKVDSANCVWVIKEKTMIWVSRGSHWEWLLHMLMTL